MIDDADWRSLNIIMNIIYFIVNFLAAIDYPKIPRFVDILKIPP